MTTIAIELPEDLFQQARAAGLLEQPTLAALLRDELACRKALTSLLDMTEPVRQGWPPMSEEEVQAFVQEAIDAVRADGRATDASSG